MIDIATFFPGWLDAFFIAPFRWPGGPVAGIWLGSAIMGVYAVVIGELTSTLLFWLNRRYYIEMQDKMVKAHNLSVAALHAGDKESYTAINKTAHEHFGKTFFAQAAVSTSSLWPVPVALAWMALRFEGIPVHAVPWTERHVGYVFVFLFLYILQRIAFARIKKHLPFFSHVENLREQARQARGTLRSFFKAA